MRSLVDEIKDKMDIADVIGGYIKLGSAGVNMKALCPFHKEKTPSFVVSKEKQIFHCFGCDKGGDVISFIQEMEGVDFKEALRILADRAGIDTSKYRIQGDGIKKEKKESIYQILELTAAFFQKSLESDEGKKAKDYLLSRGINEKTIKEFRLGYAPKTGRQGSPSALFEYLKTMNFADENITESGSVFIYDKVGKRTYFDRFRGRLIFPIADSLGRVVGFSARILPGEEDNQGKYINTPQTILYDKSRLLYGFHLAKTTIRSEDEAILLEGNLDVVLSHQAGIKYAVATCGTALTKDQISILRRYTKNLTLAFDADMAGIKATKRAGDVAWEEGMEIKAIPLETGKDVADIVKEDAKKWQKMIKDKKGLPEFFFDLAFKDRKLNLDQRKALGDKLLKIIAKLPSEVEKAHYVHRLSEELNTPENLFWEKLSAVDQRTFEYKKDEEKKEEPKEYNYMLEERIIGLVYNYPKLFKKHTELKDISFSNPSMELIWKEMKAFIKRNYEKLASGKFKWKLKNRELEMKVSEIAVKVEEENRKGSLEDKKDEGDRTEDELEFCINLLKKEELKTERQDIAKDIKKAQKKGDKKKLEKLVSEFQEVCRKLAGVKNDH